VIPIFLFDFFSAEINLLKSAEKSQIAFFVSVSSLSRLPACLSKEIVFIKLLLSNLSFLPKNLFFFLKSHV
jgi:hypothetical protein